MTYSPSGRDLLTVVKAHARHDGPGLSLPIGSPVEALLRPVATAREHLRPDDLQVLTEWRNRFVTSFLTEFEATVDRTARWLTETVGPDDTRILFMLEETAGRTVGYMGLAEIDWNAGYGEADAVVRGRPGTKGLMTRSLRTLLGWAHESLGLATLGVRVRSDNARVRALFDRLGFSEIARVPLHRKEEPGLVRWIEDESAPAGGLALVHMRLAP